MTKLNKFQTVIHCYICEGNETRETVVKLDTHNVCASCYAYATKKGN